MALIAGVVGLGLKAVVVLRVGVAVVVGPGGTAPGGHLVVKRNLHAAHLEIGRASCRERV